MAALLIYSNRCKASVELLTFINSKQQLSQIVRLHDVNMYGVPEQYKKYINRVPTLLTKNGKIFVGAEIKKWLVSLLPSEFTNFSICGSGLGASLDGDEEDNLFDLDSYGQSLQPAMTSELQAKISQSVNEAYNTNKR